MSETWQAVASGLAGLAVISGAYLYITKLMLRNGLLEMGRRHREWANGKFVTREMLEEILKRFLEKG